MLKSEKADALLPVGVIYWSEWWRENQSVTSSFMFRFLQWLSQYMNWRRQEKSIIIQQKISAATITSFNEISRKMPTEFEVYFRQEKMNTGTTYQYVGMTLLKNLCIGNPLVERERVWF